jgi:hypothetical protein
LWFFVVLLFLVLAVWIFVQTSAGQNWLTKQVTARLSKDLGTRVEIKHVDFSLFNKMHLEGVIIEDKHHDTLLYAGDLKLRITDWFFIKKNIELKYIGLENATVYLHRLDSVWNHQFIIDRFFSSSDTGGAKKGGGIELTLKNVDLKNVVIRQKDEWRGHDMLVSLGSLNLDAKDINFSKKVITINSLSMVDPVFSEYNYASRRPATVSKTVFPKPVDSLLKWNTAGWVVRLDKLEIKNGLVKEDKQSDSVLPYFDGRHVEFRSINGTFTNVRWEKDTIVAHVDLQSKERSGFEVKKLEANLKMTPQEMTFNDLYLEANNSVIRNFYRMSYDDIDDMSDYIHKVKMQADFTDSEIDSDDIAYFAPEMKTWKKKISLKGKVRGTVDDIVGREMLIQAGKNTLLNGDISLTGLPDINKTFIDFKANDFRTTYEDAVAIAPAIRHVTSPDLRKLQFIRFNGSFTGFIRDFVTFGTIQSNLGTVKSDLNLKLPAGKDPVYSGRVSTAFFRLGEFLNDPDIGAIAMDGSLRGKGFKEQSRIADLDGQIRFIEFNNYRYSNITVKGKLDKKQFNGVASIIDPSVELSMNGLVDFNGKTPVFNFKADVKHVDLKTLQLTKDDITFNGKFNLDFTGDNIDNFLGNAHITNASLTHNGVPLPFDSLIFYSEYINNQKRLTARSNEFDGTIAGNFAIRDLPDAVNLFLSRYYPAYIKPPRHVPENESFSFDITTQYVEEYLKLIDSSLSGLNYSHISGSLNTANHELALNADVPQFKFRNYNFDDVKLVATGTGDSLLLSGETANINLSDSVNIPHASFRVNARNDSSRVTIKTGTNLPINQADLNALVLTYNNGVKIEFDRSTFVVSGKTWTVDENGELEFRANTPAAGQLVLRESNQEVHVITKPNESGKWNDVSIELKKVNLGDFSPFFAPRNRLEGLVSGNLLVTDPTGKMTVDSRDVTTEGFRLDNDSIGDAKISNLHYDNSTKKLTAKGNTLNTENNLGFEATLSFDPATAKDNRISLKANHFQLKILERFLGDLFSNIDGYVTGDFDVIGEFDKLNVIGRGRLKDAGLKVNFTQCYYKIRDTEIELTPSEITLDGIVLIDPVTGNPIYLKGGIEHNAFRDMFFDVRVSTRKPGTTSPNDNRPVLLLNTGFNDNKQFYGRVKGTGSFSLSGYQSDMIMNVNAIASDRDSSIITIPSSSSRESGIADFLIEKKYGHEMTDENLTGGSSNITYDVDVTASPKLLVRVILDDLTGDEIKGRGYGSLNIHSGTSEALTMHGRLEIEEGDYLFTFQSFFKKPFKIRKGADNYIQWNGDPYAAKINFEAAYTAERVSFSPLTTTADIDPAFAKLREDVYVVVKLTGDLFKPDFAFKLDFPATSPVLRDFEVASKIRRLEEDKNEIHRQVTYLIVFNSFAPTESGAGTGSTAGGGISAALGEFANSTISSLSGLFFNEINKKLNSELAKILKTDKVSVNFSGYVYNRNLVNNQTNTIGFNQGNFNVNVPISLFKDRFIVTLGSTLDVPLQNSIQQSVQFLPDVTAEWLINETGTIRASFFYRQDLDYLTSTAGGASRNKRSGASIAYRKEFDNLSEFFKGNKPKKKLQQAPPPAKDSVQQSTSSLPPSQ